MAKIIIVGREYPSPDLGEMTMGQARTIERYTGKSIAELQTVDSSSPALIAALCHIAIQGEEPSKTYSQIEREVDAIKFASLDFTGDDEESPPVNGQNKTESEPSTSGASSEATSAETQAEILPLTGTQGSDTGVTSALSH